MNEIENSDHAKSMPRLVINLESILVFVGILGFIVLWGLKLLRDVHPFWFALVITIGVYLGPFIPLVYQYFKLSDQQRAPFSLKFVMGAFLITSLYQWYKFIVELLDNDGFIALDTPVLSILFTSIAFGLGKRKMGWWITGIIFSVLPLIYFVIKFIMNFDNLVTYQNQEMLLTGRILLYLSMCIALITPQTRKLFQKPALSPQPTSA